MKYRKYIRKIIIETSIVIIIGRIFNTDYLVLIIIAALNLLFIFGGFDIINTIINLFNPNYYKLKSDLYRHSFTESIMDTSFKLTPYEKQVANDVRKNLENTVYFEYLNKNDSLDFIYDDYKRGITVSEIRYLVKAVLRQLKLQTKFVKISVYQIGDSLKSPLGYFPDFCSTFSFF